MGDSKLKWATMHVVVFKHYQSEGDRIPIHLTLFDSIDDTADVCISKNRIFASHLIL